MAEPQHQALSPDNPWPGLDPFDEADQKYFHGRAVESEELLRRVRRELLTILFGRSGLGKTSLLKAGLFPRLREEDALPVYLRLDHAEGAPALREQVYRGLGSECEANRVQATHPEKDESLWSFFHRRDAEFWSARNRPVTPVIVLDQFEEIFTLGQETEAAQARSSAFLAEISDLIENRPSDTVRQKLESEPAAARHFDFKRSAAKVVLSFREDFLAEVEGLKESTPSLMYNRFRLLAMSGTQAYKVITCAGTALVDDDVARRILRLAWKNEPSPPVDPSDFPRIEIDPALLSVVCTELNHKRQQAKPPLGRITPEMLEGADREILSGFYERGMAGLDPRVRAFVEDELITDKGDHRDSHYLEDALARLGMTSEALDTLIRRRLLRVDERQRLRRLELTHDVLVHVVKESRDSRRVREQQRRNRRNATFVLAGALVVIVLIALAGWFAWQAKHLLREAKGTRLVADADRLQDDQYDASLLVNLEAIRFSPALDAQAGLLRRFMSHPHLSTFLWKPKQIKSVAISPDGRQLALAGRSTLALWDVDSRKLLDMLDQGGDYASNVAFSPDGKQLALANSEAVVLWDVKNHKPFAKLASPKSDDSCLAFSPDGKQLALGSQKAVILLDISGHKPSIKLTGHKDHVYAVAFSPDGKWLASASRDKTVILWDVNSHKPTVLDGHKDFVFSVAFSPDSKRLASGSRDKTVILWDVDNRKKLNTLRQHKSAVTSVAFSANGKNLASASWDKTISIWDVDSQKPLTTLTGSRSGVSSIAFSRDGRLLVSAGNDSADSAVILWEMNKHKLSTPLVGHKGAVNHVSFSRDRKWLASASEDQTVILWDLNNCNLLTRLMGHKDQVHSVAFSPDGRWLASASEDYTVILWDVNTHKPTEMPKTYHGMPFDVAFSSDGERLASTSGLDIILWNVKKRKSLATLEEHADTVFSIAFSPDGEQLASASEDRTVALWSIRDRKLIATLKGHDDEVKSVAFSPDGKLLASASRDSTIILWDTERRRPLVRLEGHEEESFLSVAFSPDGKWLASANRDKAIILWDVDSRKQLATIEGHEGPVNSVAFSPDGKKLASASEDKTIILWDLSLDALKTEACRTANRNLTCEEWRTHLGADQPYHKTCPALPGPEKCD